MRKQLRTVLILMLCLLCGMGMLSVSSAETLHPGMITITSGQSIGDGSYINHNDGGYPFIAQFTLTEDTIPMKSCTLGVYSWDCDEDASGYWHTDEYDMVFVNGTCVGVLTGVNSSWKTSYFNVPLNLLKIGNNTITIYVGHKDHATGQIVQNTDDWRLKVNWLSLQFDEGQAPEAPERFEITLTTANRTASGISCTASVVIESDKQRSYVVEYSLVDKTGSATNNQIIAGDEEYVAGTSVTSSGYFFLPSNAPMGSYEIQATLRDPSTNEILAYTTRTFDMEDALLGTCDHVGTMEKQYVKTELQRLATSDAKYDTQHRAIDAYSNVCSKCGKTFYIYENLRNEDHTKPSCACGYVDPNHNAIRSAAFSAVETGCAGEPFCITVETDSTVARLSAVNNINFPISGEWQRLDNGDGSVTWIKIYTANLVSEEQYWDVTAYAGSGAKIGTMRTNSLEVKEPGSTTIGDVWDTITNQGNYTLKVMDGETGLPVSGAQVVLMGQAGTTDANGSVCFVRKQLNGKGLVVKADKYYEHSDAKYSLGLGQTVDVIQLYKSNKIKVVPQMCNKDNISTGVAQLNNVADLQAEITVNGKVGANDQIEGYKLLQNGEELASSTDGVFKVHNTKFTKGAELKVVMTAKTSGGKIVTADETLNIVVVSVGMGNWMNLEGIPILGGMDLGINGLPDMLGNLKLSFKHQKASSHHGSLGSSYGFDDVVIDNYHITAGFGVSVNKDFVKINSKLRELNRKNGWSKDKSASFNPAFAAQWSFNETGIYETTASLGANGSVSIGKSHTHILQVGPVPIPINIKWNVGGGIGLFVSDIGYNWSSQKWVTPDATLSLSGEVGGQVGVGCDFASAGLYGKLYMNASGTASISSPVKVKGTGQIGGEVGLKAEADFGIFNWEGKVPLWEPKSEPFNIGMRPTMVYFAENEQKQYVLAEAFRNGRHIASGNVVSDVGYSNGNDEEKQGVLVTDVDALSEIQLGQVNGQKVAVYVQNDSQSETVSYGHLVYHVLENGVWSEARDLSGSGLLEADFSLAGDGENLYIAYVQAKRMTDEMLKGIEDAADLETLAAAAVETLALSEIVVARYDAAQQAFVDTVTLTDDETNDFMTSLTIVDGRPQVAWVKDPANSLFGNSGANELHLAGLDQSGVWQQQKLAEGLPMVARMQAGELAGKAYVAVITDGNNDIESVADRCLTLYGAQQSPVVVAENEVDTPAFAAVQGTPALVWYQSGRIMSVNDPAGTPVELFGENYAIPAEFMTVYNADRSYLMYTFLIEEADAASRDVLAVDLNSVEAFPVVVADADGYIDAFDAVLEDDGICFAVVHTDAVFAENDFETTSDIRVMKYGYGACAELVAMNWTTLDFLPENAAELIAYVQNAGSEPITELQVSITGAVTEEVTLETEIAPGALAEVPVVCQMPETISGVLEVRVGVPGEDLTTKTAATISLDFVDFSVDARQLVLAKQNYLLYTVQNIGSISGACTMNVRRDNAEGEIILSKEIALDAYMVENDMISVNDLVTFAEGENSVMLYVELVVPAEDTIEQNNGVFVTFYATPNT